MMDSVVEVVANGQGMPLRPVVLVHGTDGKAEDILRESIEVARRVLTFDALLICPQFPDLYQFIARGTDRAIIAHVEELAKEYPLEGQWLLYGFSGGAQFAHRFTMQHPQFVQACAPLAAGAWTAPDGEFFGMMKDVGWLARPRFNVPEVHANAERPAVKGGLHGFERVHWLTGCGRKDTARYDSAKRFYKILCAAGAQAEFLDWDLDHSVDAGVYERVLTFFSRVVMGRGQ